MLDLKTASTIATSIVHAKLDCCNYLFLNINITQISRLPAIQKGIDIRDGGSDLNGGNGNTKAQKNKTKIENIKQENVKNNSY